MADHSMIRPKSAKFSGASALKAFFDQVDTG